MASFETIERLVKQHRERKYASGFSTAFQHPIAPEKRTISPSQPAEFYTLASGSKSPAEYHGMNPEVSDFARNFDLIRTILSSTLNSKASSVVKKRGFARGLSSAAVAEGKAFATTSASPLRLPKVRTDKGFASPWKYVAVKAEGKWNETRRKRALLGIKVVMD